MSQNPRLFLSPPHMGGRESDFVQQAFASNYIAPLGPMVDAFEREFAAVVGLPHCLALASGTAATHLALRHLGVKPGDEILASTLTFIGSVTPATFERATLAFIDCDDASWNMDPAVLEQALADGAKRGQLPKAVIPTDLYGQPCDLPRIRAICDRHGVPAEATPSASTARPAHHARCSAKSRRCASTCRVASSGRSLRHAAASHPTRNAWARSSRPRWSGPANRVAATASLSSMWQSTSSLMSKTYLVVA